MDKPAVPEQKAEESVKEKKKRTAKKRCEQKDELMSEQKVDKFINIRQEIEIKCQEIEDEVLDINGELDSCVDRLRMYDQCLDQAVRLEQRLLPHVIFDDVDDTAQQNDLIDVIQRVDPIMITNSGLEPLNVKLTEFINNPVLHCIDSNADTAATRSRTVTSTDHISPTFDDIKALVEGIRAQGDCPRVDVLAPADNLTVYDQFVCKVLADLLDILKRKRYFTNLEQIERHVQDRQGQAVTANGEELEASGPPEQHDEMTASTAGTSTHEKILEAIQKGDLQTEGEDAVADGEDVGEAEDDESHSEAGSDDFTDSAPSTGAVALQQHIVKADDDEVVMEDVQQQSSLSSNSSPCTDGLPSTSASQPSSSTTNTASLTSSSEKVRLQQHQLNKLFSSAARLRSSPPLEPSLSTLKPDLIDLTLEDNGDNDDEKRSEISERTDGHDELSNDEDDDDSDTVMAVADSSDLEIIEELNEDNDDEWPVETVSDASTIPTDALEEAKAMLNGGGRRKRKSEDEESDVEVNRKKRTKEAIEDTVMVDDDEDVVVEDVGADDIDKNDDEEEKAVKTEQNPVLAVDAADIEDDEAPEAKKADDDNGHQLMDEESIIYLSDG